VKLGEARAIYESAFQGEDSHLDGVWQQDQNKAIELEAFLEAFCKLRPHSLQEHADMKGEIALGSAPASTSASTNSKASLWAPPSRVNAEHERSAKCLSHGGSLRRLATSSAGTAFMPRELPGHQCPDLLTLVRNVIVTKLVQHLGLTVRSIFSPCYRFIYLLVAADELDLARQAAWSRYPIDVEMTRMDPEAFEPCDELSRPLIESFFEDGCQEVVKIYERFVASLRERCCSPPSALTAEPLFRYFSTQLERLRARYGSRERTGETSKQPRLGRMMQDAYCRYLQKRCDGLGAADALRDTNEELARADAELRCFWDWVHITPPILTAAMPYKAELPASDN